jgi:hypothetical protein
MAEQVTGQIGSENVILNNAASEATLLKLLEAFKAQGGSTSKISGVAGAAGIDPATIKAATEAVDSNTKAHRNLTKEAQKFEESMRDAAQTTINRFALLNQTILGLMAGTQQTSTIVAGIGQQFGGTAGILIAGMSKLIAMQEENFATYQKLSASGVNFSGSLTQMRMAAADAYLTIDEFSKIMKDNSEAFARMGGTADEGARAFSAVGKELIQSPVGKQLMALGYTTEEVNSGLASYIAMTGGRNAQEMKDTKALSAAAGNYLKELDDLAQITGKSRQQQEEALKEASANQAYQSYLLTLDEKGREKAQIAMAEAMAKGGKGATEALQSRLLGLPPITKAAQEFEAVAPKMAAANRKMADAVGDASKGVADVKRAGGELGLAANQTKKDLGDTGKALIMQGGSFSSTIGAIFGTANRNAQQGVETMEDVERQRAEIEGKRKEREKSEADDMSEAMRGLKQLGAELWSVFSPLLTAVSKLASWIGSLAGLLADGLKKFNLFFEQFGTAGTIVKGIVVALGVWLAAQKLANAQAVLKSASGSIAEGFMDRARGVLPGGGGGSPRPPAPPMGGLGGAAGAAAGGGGGGFVGFIKSLGRGLASLAPIAVPMLIGAGAVAGVITLLGAGVAAAVALIGLSLPTFANGLKAIAEIDGLNLIAVAGGIGALGLAMVAFTAGSVIAGLGTVGAKIANFFSGGGPVSLIKDTVKDLTPILPQLERLGPSLNSFATGLLEFGKGLGNVDSGKVKDFSGMLKTVSSNDTFAGLGKLAPILPQLTQIGPALNSYANGIVAFGKAVNTVDLVKAEKLKEVIKGPGLLEGIGSAIKDVGAATSKLVSSNTGGQEKSSLELSALNSTMKEILRYMKETADNTKRNIDATKGLNGNLFA